MGFAVMSGAKNPEGATEFVKYMGSADAESYLCQMEGRIPVNTGVYDDGWYLEDPYIKVYGEIMASDKTRYITHPIWLPTWNEFRSRVEEPALQAVLLKEKTAKEALDEMATYLTKAQKEYLASK
jgi:multiple sugar transport system substrate-binding protein